MQDHIAQDLAGIEPRASIQPFEKQDWSNACSHWLRNGKTLDLATHCHPLRISSRLSAWEIYGNT